MITRSGTQSNDALWEDLHECCQSESLSEDALRGIIERYDCDCALNNDNFNIENYNFIAWACHNERCTEGIIRCLLEYFPDAAGYYSRGKTPHHYICGNKNATRGMVQLLVDASPESIDRATNAGNTPLHFLCSNENLDSSIKLDILGLLLERYPEAAQHAHPDDDGYTPLNLMCLNKNVTRGMVKLLIDAYPESLRIEDNTGQTPLHKLCINQKLDDAAAVDILGLFLEKSPDSARRLATSLANRPCEALPIQLAIINSKTFEFCRMLIEAYPGSEKITTSPSRCLPIHVACSKYNEVATVQYLLGLYPESINVANRRGHYPIHYAIEGLNGRTNPRAAVEMFQLLLDCDPDVALQKMNGIFPLVMIKNYATNNRNNASKVNAALKILQLLYDAHPKVIEDDGMTRHSSVIPREVLTFINTQLICARQARNSTARQMNTRDENGQVPLHRAIRDNATLGSIKLLVKRNPSAVLIPDNSGALPLHVACQHNDSPKVVDHLIGLDSDTLTAVDREGNTALHLACRGVKYDTIALLLKKYGAVSVSQSNVYNKLPIHLLLESDATASRAEDTKYLESVFQLLRANPETVMLPGDEKQQTTRNGGRPSRSGKKRKYCA